MKKVLTVAMLLSSCAAFAQTSATVVNMKEIKGSDLIKMMPKITDSKIYDREGNVVDSVKVHDMVKSFEYTTGIGKPQGQTEYKRMVFKVDHATEARFDDDVKVRLRPKSSKLWEGAILDLKPLAKHTDLNKLTGKALVIIFRTNIASYKYDRVNEVIADYIAGNKFTVFSITNLSYEDAIKVQRVAPILNAHNIVDAPEITEAYGTENKAIIVVTDIHHQITYAITGEAAMTPRLLNGLLKSL